MTEKQFETEKERIMELVVPHMLHPDLFPAPSLTLEDMAILEAAQDGTGAKGVKTKMCMCKREKKIMNKLRLELAKTGITGLGDVLSVGNREFATVKNYGASDIPV